MDSNLTVCEEKLTTCNPNRKGIFIDKVDTIAFRFCRTIIRTMRGYISDVKYSWMYKKCKNI